MSAPIFATLEEAAAWYRRWFADAALPLWAEAGMDPSTGAFQELLTLDGVAVDAPRRARVQARQVFVYASATQAGFGARWLDVARRGYAYYREHYRRPDGLFAVTVDLHGRQLDETPFLYEQAFSLLAMAALTAVGAADLRRDAERLLAALQGVRHAEGGFREFGEHAFQSNAHMHLLEAALAWEELGAGASWSGLADEIVALCRARFIDAESGFLREFFDAAWRPAAGDDGRWVEPGHQFEWAWLLERWGRARGDAGARAAARRLFGHGLRGVDRSRGVAVNVLWDDLTVRDGAARLWPQTEYLKAALILGDAAAARGAATGLAGYLQVPARGAWRDKQRPDGTFVDEPAPASSFYHLMVAILELLGRN
jgi:mannose-1-phosphate guanylyltransferase/mannose-6-phosphate isomerase